MATPRADTYSAATGAAIAGGRQSGWWDPMTSNSFFEVPNSSMATLVAPLIPAGGSPGYIGTDSPEMFANAYGCAAIDETGDNGIWAGPGGHTNTSVGGVWKRNYTTMQVTCLQPPTPPAKYPPAFRVSGSNQPGPIQYPSGLNVGRFCLESELSGADAGWGAPYQAPAARHIYQSNAIDKNGKVQGFYLKHTIFDTTTGLWTKCGTDDFGAKLAAAYSNFGSTALGHNTSTIYDKTRHVLIVVVVPGDEGASWRHGFVEVDADTGSIITYRQGDPYSSYYGCSMVQVGRYIYGFHGQDDGVNGWRYHLDTKVTQWIRVQGDTFSFPTRTTTFEQIPTCYHPVRGSILRWEYVNNRAAFYETDLTVLSGAGTLGDPLMFQQTRRAISGTAPSTVILNYQMHYHPPSQSVLLEPAAQSNMFAVRIQ